MPAKPALSNNTNKLLLSWFGLLVAVIVLCSVILITNNFNKNNNQYLKDIALNAQNFTNASVIESVEPTSFVNPTIQPTETLIITPTIAQETKTAETKTNSDRIAINAEAPLVCASGNCTGTASKVGTCANGICGATTLTFTVTPNADGTWSYNFPEGLAPGDYEVTIKDPSGKVLEVSKFTVTTTEVKKTSTNLPNTGVMDSLYIPLGVSIVLLIISFLFVIRPFPKK